MSKKSERRSERATYRHGDLHGALVRAGLDLARDGGPEAVVLREATRRAGVAPSAAYRHFADREALLAAVCSAAQAEFARAIEAEQAAVDPGLAGVALARARFWAVGLGYMGFARREPGLFQAAFWLSRDLNRATSPERRGETGLTPFELLGAALDGLVAAGVLPPERRPGAELLAWSAVHGLATLRTEGPLGGLPADQIEALERRLVESVERGL
ncbi:TetR family transcriptional regulator (plasmid) [Deinococcus aetherius]|uniref:TetR family transcriptional regulator n=1 Tax=Deinococcus aetherius TaxID=200252 RepID=A0ABM8AJB6_9DEIO|nr:TetR/AcrR family transcriptional regulator [Deinococcus aetherius]BDP43901.1 TetR family transcriptional regulator [Deinococcus aetherius]